MPSSVNFSFFLVTPDSEYDRSYTLIFSDVSVGVIRHNFVSQEGNKIMSHRLQEGEDEFLHTFPGRIP